MSHSPDEFGRLRSLLALKRHEVPPPGYFDDFSRQVIVRIRAGDVAEERQGLLSFFAGSRWLEALFSFQAKPALACVFGLAVCGVLLVGAFHSESNSQNAAGLLPPLQSLAGSPNLQGSALPVRLVTEEATPLPFLRTNGTEPGVLQNSLFDEFQSLRQEQPLLINHDPGK